MGEWKTKVGDTGDIGQELGTILTGDTSSADQFQKAAKASGDGVVAAAVSAAGVEAAVPAAEQEDRGRRGDRRYKGIEAALSPTHTPKIRRGNPAHLRIQ